MPDAPLCRDLRHALIRMMDPLPAAVAERESDRIGEIVWIAGCSFSSRRASAIAALWGVGDGTMFVAPYELEGLHRVERGIELPGSRL